MNEKIRNFFSTPIIKLAIHFVIVLLVFLNIGFSYQDKSTESYISQKYTNLSYLESDNYTSNDRSDYLNSSLHKEKIYKEEGYKIPGEEVIETGFEENNIKQKTEFLPEQIKDNDDNLQKWWQCLIVGQINQQIVSNQTDNQIKNCK